ncbi:MAG: hypothetical protein NZ953_02710 [Thaumarchaeota archaeon]|nr:hypothetical protein [Candidatus Calditenuaceae archaeon]MCX8203616.1 hypothetical protein [Nitrososphaeria archaeon]MDW8042920.1 hypothetical protein [Nitrososphaerota archaeon]
MSHAERFGRLARRALEPGISEEELWRVAEEMVVLKRELRSEHGFGEGDVPFEEEVRLQFSRLRALRENLGVDG